jgi:ParB-like chromosome segregation protein Spo0J
MKVRPTNSHRPSNRTRPGPLSHSELRIEYVPVRDLRPNEKNSRLHPRKQIEKLARAIRDFGFLIPVLIDAENKLIAGHARVEAAQALGHSEVPCIRATHLSEVEKHAFTIVDNRLAEDSAWDFRVLAKELEFLQVEGVDLQMTGFEIPELEGIFAASDASPKDAKDDEIQELQPGRAITRSNDIWTLGEHRLLCADARRRDSFTSLLGSSRAYLVFVDPLCVPRI